MNTTSPCAGLPLPGGSSAPSGPIERSHARNSVWLGVRPRPEGDGDCGRCCAEATIPSIIVATSAAVLTGVHVGHKANRRQTVDNLPIAVDPPRLNPVAVSELALDRGVQLRS